MVAALAAAIKSRFPAGCRIAVGLSGGLDSVVLMHALHAAQAHTHFILSAHHVCHGLSPHADEWARFCARSCEALGLPFTLTRLQVRREAQQSLEALAREARHSALRALPVEVVALAHHADDQAETVLLQLLRGAGVAGLAAMPAWAAGPPALWRPLLSYRRAELAAWATHHRLSWIEDDSNADRRLRRNALRHEVTPQLATHFPGYPQTLARSARHCAEAAQMLRELAVLDGLPQDFQQGLPLAALAALSSTRARNLLRQFFLSAGLLAPSEARLEALCQSLASKRADARSALEHQGLRLVREGGRLYVLALAAPPFCVAWHGEEHLDLPHGVLSFEARTGEGLRPEFARQHCAIVPCPRGARLALAPGQSARPVRELLRQRGVPVWAREAWPVVQQGSALLAVPGVGVAFDARGEIETLGLVPIWRASGPDADRNTEV